MLERKDKMRVCLIWLTCLSIQIPNFSDTLAILLLSRLSLTALSAPIFFPRQAACMKKFKFAKGIRAFKNERNSWLKTWTNEALLTALFYAPLT